MNKLMIILVNKNSVIETGDEEIQFILIDNQNKQTIGISSLNISDLKNQQQFDTELQLQNDYGKIVGSLKISMRWIHSKVQYLQDVLNKWEEYAASQSQDLEDYQRDILTLYEPFKQLQIYNRSQLNQPSQNQAIQSNTNPFTEEQQMQLQYSGPPRMASYKATFLEQTPNDAAFLSGGNQLDYKRVAQLATIGYLCMVLLVSFERSMFFDLLVIFKYYDYHLKEEFTGEIYKYFTITIFCSFVIFDLGWIINFTKIWFGGDFPDNGVKYFVDLLTILLFLYKLFLMVTYILNWNHYEQIQAQLRGSVNPANQLLQQQVGNQENVQNNQQYMNQSNPPIQAQDNNYLNSHFLSNLNNPKFNQQQNLSSQQQYPDTMKTTRKIYY